MATGIGTQKIDFNGERMPPPLWLRKSSSTSASGRHRSHPDSSLHLRHFSVNLEPIHDDGSGSNDDEVEATRVTRRAGKAQKKGRGINSWKWSKVRVGTKMMMMMTRRRRSNLTWIKSRRGPTHSQGRLACEEAEDEEHHKGCHDDIVQLGPGRRSYGESLSLSKKYEPRVFQDIIGHEIVVRALSSAIHLERHSPMYLFHGPGGTGKTSTARVFSTALGCESPPTTTRPCWRCKGCFRSLYLGELYAARDGGDNTASSFERIKTLLQGTSFARSFLGPKAFIIEDCHSLPVDAWEDLLNMAEVGSIVFIFITEDASKVQRAVSSRCQKFAFPKLRDTDVALKMEQVCRHEGIEIGMDAMKLIITKADGSLREAENILDQLSLLGSRITASLVQQLVGLVPCKKLHHLLEAVMSTNSVKAVRCVRELIASGFEHMAIVSQLASLVTDILATTKMSMHFPSMSNEVAEYQSLDGKMQPEKLCHALKVLIETEKQLMSFPCNQTTWLTAALLQIASDDARSKHNSTDMNHKTRARANSAAGLLSNIMNSENLSTTKGIDLEEVWCNILGRIQNKYLEEILSYQARLVSLTVSRANAIVHLAFKRADDKVAAQRSEKTITIALGEALGCPVDVNMSWEPMQLDIGLRRAGLIIEKPVVGPGHERSPIVVAAAVKRSLSQRDATLPDNNARTPSVMHDSMPMILEKGQMIKENDSSLAEVNQIPPTHCHLKLIRGISGRNSMDGKSDPYKHDQTSEATSIMRTTELKNRLLSLSSIQQTDASIEPYSQDLIFEKTNKCKQQRTRKPKIGKTFSGEMQRSHSTTLCRGLNRSWGYTNMCCRNEAPVESAVRKTPSDILRWSPPCTDSCSAPITAKKKT
ncbi:hypothetical protein QJS10_CPA05g02504 [Acorus calamus]|uniref:AAA+ ATPase domain-containing protein n=1 Tax=Acorus calamus TaxID=4465 RepID=A0AAV9EWE8_ACOCL|nr:hypothetical protein QJS10_CPA05g02504 [Acorus calamus]